MKYAIFTILFYWAGLGLSAQNELSFLQINQKIVVFEENGDFENAVLYAKQGLAKAEREKGKLDALYTDYLYYLGHLYLEMNKYEESESYLLAALELKEKAADKNDSNYAATHSSLVALYVELGKISVAEKLCLKQKASLEKDSSRRGEYAITLNNLAQLYQEVGDYAQAEPLMQEILLVNAATEGKKSIAYCVGLNNLATLYMDMKQENKALPLLLQALELYMEMNKKNDEDYCTVISNLADVYRCIKDYPKSLSLLLELSQLDRQNLGDDSPEYANTLSNLAGVYLALNQYESAEAALQQSVQIILNNYDDSHPDFIVAQNNLAKLYTQWRKNDLAWQHLQIAISQTSQLPMSINISHQWADSLLNANYITNVALKSAIESLQYAYQLTKDNHKKIIVANVATALLQKNRAGLINDADKLRILAQSNQWLAQTLKVLDPKTQIKEAFAAAQLNKSVLLMQANNRNAAQSYANLPPQYCQAESKLYNQQAHLEARLQENLPKPQKDSLRQELNKLNIDIKAFKLDLENKFPQYARLKNQQAQISIADVQANLAPNAALIEYVVAPDQLYIFYIDQKQSHFIALPISHDSLSKKINLLHHALSDYVFIKDQAEQAYTDYTTSAHWFYLQTIAPVLVHTAQQNIKQLIIIPDAELGFLPFEAFLTQAAPPTLSNYADLPYLLHDFSISYHYSASLAMSAAPSEQANNGLILAMAAQYSPKNATSNALNRAPAQHTLRKILAPLPAAKQEVEDLKAVFAGHFAMDSTASERQFKQKAADFAVIHLAMHGILDQQKPVLSSLAFTEDGDTLEDNFLQAFEIQQLQLNAQLVVLSACETGYGKFQAGNGMASLARAFMYAGTPALLVSLWSVNDMSTALIMQDFYLNIADNQPKDQALQKAKIKYLQKAQGISAHPAFWSPFVQIGSNKSISISSKHEYKTYILYVGIFVAVLALAFFFIRAKKRHI